MFLMTPRQAVVHLLSDLEPHTQDELTQVIPPGQLDAVLTSLTGPKIEVDGDLYWICEDDEAGTVVYQLFLCW